MTNTTKNYNSIDPSEETTSYKIHFTQSNIHSRVSSLIDPILKQVKDLSFRHLGSPTYFIANQDDTVIQKVLKIASWICGISPVILTLVYLYDALLNLHRQYFQKYSKIEKCSDETLKISPYNSFDPKARNIDAPLDSTVRENIEKPSRKDFEILDPIIVDHKDTKIDTTAFSIKQITQDLHRMNLVVNGAHCLNIQDFMSHLGLTFETDISHNNTPIIRKILHFSHQGIFAPGNEVLQNVMNFSNSNLFASQFTDVSPTINIHWNAELPEKTEIIAEAFLQINFSDGITPPNANPYVLRIKHSLDREEITFQQATFLTPRRSPELKEPQNEPEVEVTEKAEMESSTITEFDKDSFVEVDLSDDLENNINYNQNIAFKRLKDEINFCLTSTVTSEYLDSLKIKYPHFIFNDRLMLPVPITTDEIANSLNKLKNTLSNYLIFLPFLVNGWSVDHAVTAVLNTSNGSIEYFDPKGQGWFTTRTEKQSGKNVFDFLTEIGQKVISPTFSKDKILYNKKNIPQGFFDNINCGTFCLQFIEERINHSFDAIEEGITGRLVNPIDLRRQLANKLIENTYSNSV